MIHDVAAAVRLVLDPVDDGEIGLAVGVVGRRRRGAWTSGGAGGLRDRW